MLVLAKSNSTFYWLTLLLLLLSGLNTGWLALPKSNSTCFKSASCLTAAWPLDVGLGKVEFPPVPQRLEHWMIGLTKVEFDMFQVGLMPDDGLATRCWSWQSRISSCSSAAWTLDDWPYQSRIRHVSSRPHAWRRLGHSMSALRPLLKFETLQVCDNIELRFFEVPIMEVISWKVTDLGELWFKRWPWHSRSRE